MINQTITLCRDLTADLSQAIHNIHPDHVFLLTDTHTHQHCLPLLKQIPQQFQLYEICVEAGDEHKNIDTLTHIWSQLSNHQATRHSLLINLGGGMITDLGGFAAATFKRGIPFINLPTTLLAMVDASAGGKTGINFNGLKNEVGTFASAQAVLLETEFLATLDHENLLSGYGEMLKHGLIATTEHWAELLNFNTEQIDLSLLKQLVGKSVDIKQHIVQQDPYEKNIRKALNFGHTIGHAFESMALADGHPVLHGYAVAWGVVCELYLSCLQCQFPTDRFRQTASFVRHNYGTFAFDCKRYEQLYGYMRHDKKNEGDHINFTLLSDIGDIRINQTAEKKLIFEVLDFFRESMN